MLGYKALFVDYSKGLGPTHFEYGKTPRTARFWGHCAAGAYQ